MREVIQCLIDWLKDNPSETKAHRILSALANEALKKADLDEELSRFDSMDIAVAANEKKENTSEANDWIDWKRTVSKYWQTRENQVIEFAKIRDLKFYPKPDRISTTGGPDPTTYLIKAEPLHEIEKAEQLSLLEANNATSENHVHYDLVAKGEVKPAWIAKWLLHTGEVRLSMRHITSIIIFILIIGVTAALISLANWLVLTTPRPVTTRELTMFLSMFIIPYGTWHLFIKPWIRLFDDRIMVAPELLVSMNEKSAQIELFRDGDLRLIRLVRYSAPCPICGATIHLDKGEPDYPRRLVGRCYDSPREHVFSFDRVTQKGVALKGTELIKQSSKS